MNHWPFIIGAYAIGLIATAGLTFWSWAAMRRAEDRVEKLSREP